VEVLIYVVSVALVVLVGVMMALYRSSRSAVKVETVYLGNVDENRVEAEISRSDTNETLAIVYKSEGRMVVEQMIKGADRCPGYLKAVEDAKANLDDYVHPEGIEVDEGMSRAAHSLLLMLKKDGTAMGIKID